jgi:hypothetical protein
MLGGWMTGRGVGQLFDFATLREGQMLRKLWLGAFAVGICLGGSAAHAAIQNGDQVKISRLNHVNSPDTVANNLSATGGAYLPIGATYGGRGGGGEFLIDHLESDGVNDFKTFCLERDEFIGIPGTYYVTVDPAALYGGLDSTTADPIDDRTKWLYYWYVKDLLDTVPLSGGPQPGDDDFKYEVVYSANELQEAIWHIEQEGVTADGLAANLIAAASANPWNPLLGDVLALNLWSTLIPSETSEHQSQLYYLPPQPGAPLPEPMSVAIWGLLAGVGSVVAWRRRRRVEG